MARIQLENRLDAPLERLIYTGRAYTVEPPLAIPPHSRAFWDSDDTGTVTYVALPLGTHPAPAGTPGGTRMTTPPAATASQRTSSGPTPAVSAARRFTLAWQFAPPARPVYVTENVDAGLRLRVKLRTRPDGAIYTLTPARHRRPPRAPHLHPQERGRRPLQLAALLAGLLLLLTAASAAAYAISGGNPGVIFGHGGPGSNGTPQGGGPTPTLSLAADRATVPIGTRVTLTATTNSALPSGGYGIAIVNTTAGNVVAPSPCKTGTTCTAGVTSTTPASITYQAYVELGYQTQVLLTSSSVTVTWLPPNVPSKITLSANLTADSTGRVQVQIGTTGLLTAVTDLPVDNTGYQIDIVDTTHNKSALTTSPCTRGTSCATQVKSASPASITYVAYVEARDHSGVRVPSAAITVMWTPPQPPSDVRLASNPAADSSGSVNVVIGKTVILTATVTSKLDNTGYQIDIFDTNGNRVGGPCKTGKTCTARVTSASPAANVYIARAEKSTLSGILATSSTIAVTWSLPSPPASFKSFSADQTNVPIGTTVTLTAITDRPVDKTGYQIDIVNSNGVVVGTCKTGSTCYGFVVASSPVSLSYTAYVDQGYPNGIIVVSNAVSVTWYIPLPTQISITSNPAPNCAPTYDLCVDDGTPVTLTAITDRPVDNTGYQIDIFDITDNLHVAGPCHSGTTCSTSPPVVSSTDAVITYMANVEVSIGNGVILQSHPFTVSWSHTVFLPAKGAGPPAVPPASGNMGLALGWALAPLLSLVRRAKRTVLQSHIRRLNGIMRGEVTGIQLFGPLFSLPKWLASLQAISSAPTPTVSASNDRPKANGPTPASNI